MEFDKKGQVKKPRTERQTAARRKAIRARLSQPVRERGGLRRPAHATKIAAFHTIEKRLAQADGSEREALVMEQHALGGLQSYQEASKTGARHGESSKWLVHELKKRQGRRPTFLLDVGAIEGTAYKRYKFINSTSIDLAPQASHVVQADFFEFPVPKELFDVVSLSLVLNYVGDLSKRSTCDFLLVSMR